MSYRTQKKSVQVVGWSKVRLQVLTFFNYPQPALQLAFLIICRYHTKSLCIGIPIIQHYTTQSIIQVRSLSQTFFHLDAFQEPEDWP